MIYENEKYKRKAELTSDKLFHAVLSALESYMDLVSEDNSDNIDRVIEAAILGFKERQIATFTKNVSKQLVDILCLNNSHEEQQASGFMATKVDGCLVITTCFGEFERFDKLYVEDVIPVAIADLIKIAEKTKTIHYGENDFAACYIKDQEIVNTLYMKINSLISERDKNLIEIFSATIKAAFDRMYRRNEEIITQERIIFTFGEVAESRSQVMDNHVRRVSEYAKFLAMAYGMSFEEVEMIALASPVHDIGKMNIAEDILNKPGKLTMDEFEVMKTHAITGYHMLAGQNDPLFEAAAIIALSHHEKWNGTGYPYGLSGVDIHIFGRIVALVDVFDALGTDRVYKKAWSMDRIIELIQKERGQHFDPKLVDIFMENKEALFRIRDGLVNEVVEQL